MSEIKNTPERKTSHGSPKRIHLSSLINKYPLEDKYTLREQIGQGSFGCVYKAIHKLTNIEVSIKMVDKKLIVSNGEAKSHFENEIIIMKDLNHPLITQLYEIVDSEDHLYIVLEYAKSDLLRYLNNKTECMDEKEARKIFTQLIYVLQYLHNTKKIAHRDLKPENILLDSNNNIKLIDFGFSKSFDKNILFSSLCGSPAYVAPEIVTGKKYNQMSDIWSSGIILYAMITGQLPFNGSTIEAQLKKTAFEEPYYPSRMSNQLVKFLQRILQKDYHNRPSLEELLEDPWMAEQSENECWASLFTQDTSQIDFQILTQMNFLGIEYDGIEKDLLMNKMNDKTVSYRLLQRAKLGKLLKSPHIGKIKNSPSCFPGSPIFMNRMRVNKRSPIKSLTRSNKKSENDCAASNHTPDPYHNEKQCVARQRNTFLASPVKTVRPCVKSHDLFHQNNELVKPKALHY